MKRIALLFMFVLLLSNRLMAVSSDLLTRAWPAQWIAPADVSLEDYGVYHFRKTFDINTVPRKFVIHVSADNRYELFVNGKRTGMGPARGDLAHWRFETYDIASLLSAGENCVAVVVWNFGEHKPWAQMSSRTGLIVQGEGAASVLTTDTSWKVVENQAYQPTSRERGEPHQFIVVGPGDRVDGALYPYGWQNVDFDDSSWLKPRVLEPGKPVDSQNTGMEWGLIPRNIPPMIAEKEPLRSIRRTEGIEINSRFLSGEDSCVVPAGQRVSLLLDQSYLTIAYPELLISGGAGSEITLVYSEALFDHNYQKGHRDEIENRQVFGPYDVFLPDGGVKRSFRSLWFRTYRYIQVEIETADESLVIHQLHGMKTGYPFEENAVFTSDRPELKQIWDTGWRTARLCAGENYFDCPFYEQLQYVGDTRIQALISLYVSGDDRLMRNAILHFHNSRIPEGLTQSRYPSNIQQVIPPYSLFWIAMVYDYWMHCDDEAFVKQFIPGIKEVIRWHKQYVDGSGMLGRAPYWPFVDWANEWPWNSETQIGGVPSGASEGYSSILTLQLAYVLEMAEALMNGFNESHEAKSYAVMRGVLNNYTKKRCWHAAKGLLADTPDQKTFSQHGNLLAILSGMVQDNEAKKLMKKILTDQSLIQCTLYYQFYITRALLKTGMADRYLLTLGPWQEMLDNGLTTFAEKPDPTRSDCHAWSASPNYEFLSTVCGIGPAEPGFKSVLIVPALGDLKFLEAKMPHPKGEIKVKLKRQENQLDAEVALPKGVHGRFVWAGETKPLTSGAQHLKF